MSSFPGRWAASAVIGILLLVTGFVAGRAVTSGSTTDTGADTPAPAPTATGVATQPTAEASPRSAEHRRTRDGAVAAATAYGIALDGPGLLVPEARRELIEEVAAAGARRDLEEVLGRVAALLTSRLGLTADAVSGDTFVWRTVPAGWQIRRFEADRAVVAVWATGVAMAHGRLLAQPGWRTAEVELVWERGAWRLVGFRSQPGPEPPHPGEQAAGLEAARAMNRFQPFTHLPSREDGR